MTTAAPPASPAGPSQTTAFVATVGSFLLWGLVAPVFFKSLGHAGPFEIVAHRVIWTVVLVGAYVLAVRGYRAVIEAVGTWKRAGTLILTTALVTTNWTVFIWAVTNGRMVESSLGYFINPLVNVLLGVLFLKERLSRYQLAAVLIAAAGVLGLIVAHGIIPWVAFALAFSFGFYALVRKKAAVDPLVGLVVETSFLVPAALGVLAWLGADNSFGQDLGGSLMLVMTGPMTAVPLILFMVGASRLRLSTVGLLQYIGPTGQLFLGVVVYGEPFTSEYAAVFACIWVALVIYSADAFTTHRAAARAAAAE